MKQSIELLLGPPGTGKTTRCINIVEEALEQGILPERIAYMSFTKKAAQEAIDRASERFKLNKKRFPYFRTLHSLAFRLAGLERTDVMGNEDYHHFGNSIGMPIAGDAMDILQQTTMYETAAMGNKCLRICHLAQAKRSTVEEEWQSSESDFPLSAAEYFRDELENYKEERLLREFSDFMDLARDELPVDLFVLDEAQDLTPQQWEFFQHISARAKRVVIAGDDDQAIYEWAGANVAHFIEARADKRETLPVSHRLPQAIFDLADEVAQRIVTRFDKEWSPRAEDGDVEYHQEVNSIRMDGEGDWMILGRNRRHLNHLVKFVRHQGFVYHYKGKWSNRTDEVKAVLLYENARAGKHELSQKEQDLVQSYSSEPLDFERDWMEALDRMGLEQQEYIRAVKRNGYSLKDPGNVRISTIHASKGGEADNVILCTDYGNMVKKSYLRDPDQELRVWYVGITRARQRLILVGNTPIWRT